MADPTVTVLASFRLPAAALARFREIAPHYVALTRAEAGCIAYDLAEDLCDAGMFRVSELWASEAHLRAHLAAPHMAELGNIRAEMGMTERQLRVFALAGPISL